jgi:CubicO group peptidase (beta-lactamase class C family)
MNLTRRRFLILAAALASLLSCATVPDSDDALIGLWSFHEVFAPAAQGELALMREGSTWRGSFGGATVNATNAGDEIHLAFPKEAGRFRGRLSADENSIAGFWIRPGAGNDPRDAGGSAQAFATPLTLEISGPNTWSGRARTLENSFTLYLKVFRNEKNELLAAFRNPDQNSVGGAMQFRVTRSDSAIRFGAGGTPEKPQVELKATWADRDTLRVDFPDFKGAIELKRRTPAEAAAFFPRPPAAPLYQYRQPDETGDGWETARARDVGIDEAALTALVQRLAAADPAVRRPSLMHSVLVAHRGKLVLEEYFFGFARDQVHDTRSAGKTFASILMGAAQMRGKRIAPDTRVYEMLAARGPFANPDPRKRKITFGHLMTHTSGLACDDNNDASPGNEGTMQSQAAQPDWWKYTLDLPMAHEPGKRYAYCSANMNLVGAGLTTATGTWLPQFFEQAIARPLQFGEWHWNLQPTGEGYLGGGAWLRSRDLLKVGQAFLDGGQWHGKRIVNAAWVKASTTPRMQISPATTGLTEEQFGEFYGQGVDAWAWHLGAISVGERSYKSYGASGNGGQLLVVVPELQLTAVFTGGNYRQGGIWSRWPNEILGGTVIPALAR